MSRSERRAAAMNILAINFLCGARGEMTISMSRNKKESESLLGEAVMLAWRAHRLSIRAANRVSGDQLLYGMAREANRCNLNQFAYRALYTYGRAYSRA